MKISSTQMFYFKVPLRKPENIKKRIAMPKIMHNLVILMDSSELAWNISVKGGNMCLNRFCIEEDAAFELSKVHLLQKYVESQGKGYKILTINDIAVENNLKTP